MQQTQNKLKHNNINNHAILDQTVFLLDQTIAIPNQKKTQNNLKHNNINNHTLLDQYTPPSGSNNISSGSTHTTIWTKQQTIQTKHHPTEKH